MRSRLLSLSVALVVALLTGGADGCSSDPNVEGAKLALNTGDYDRALELLDSSLETNPDNVSALVLKLETYRKQYEATAGAGPKRAYLDAHFADMLATVRHAQAVAPDDADVAQTTIATWAIAINTGNEIVRDADADVTAAVPYLQAAMDLVPDSSQGYLSLGIAYLRDANATEALAPLQQGTERFPEDPTLAYYYGRALLLADRASDAITFLEAAQARFPDDQDVQTMLLNAYTSGGQTDQALERYASAVVSQPDNPTIRYNYGALLLGAHRYEEAIEQLTAATELAPDNADAFYNLGAAYQNRAAALNEQGNNTEDSNAANALYEQKNQNLEMALVPLAEARRLASGTPDEAGVCDALFRVYTQLNRLDEAEEVSTCAGQSMN